VIVAQCSFEFVFLITLKFNHSSQLRPVKNFLTAIAITILVTSCSNVGRQMPEFSATSLSGLSINSNDMQGKIVVIDIWATWCGPCVEEMPMLQSLHDEGVAVVVGVSIDAEGFEVVRPFLDSYAITFPVVHDAGDLQDVYGPLLGVPTTYLLGTDGSLVHRWTGIVSESALRGMIAEMVDA